MTNGEPVRRAEEIEELSNLYFIHPISARLTRIFAALRVTPNAVSLAGMLFGISAGFAYFHYQDSRCAIAGFLLMIAWHIMDGADGQLARLRQMQSELGKILDGVCDYVTFTSVYLGFGVALSQRAGEWVWIVVVSSGLCHAIQAAAYEVRRQEYNFWGLDRKSAGLPGPQDYRAYRKGKLGIRRSFGFLYGMYVKMQYRIAGVTVGYRQQLAARLEQEPERASFIRAQYRKVFAPSIRHWALLSSNYRTVAIFLCALLQVPLYYFLFEIVVLTSIMLVLASRQRGRYEKFFRLISSSDGPDRTTAAAAAPTAISQRMQDSG